MCVHAIGGLTLKIINMAFITIAQLQDWHRQKKKGALIAIDPGTKTFGLALSDTERLIANPLYTLKRGRFMQDAAKIYNIFSDNTAYALVVGYPVSLDGQERTRAQSVRDFAYNFLSVYDIPLLLWDERLSTQAMTRALLGADVRRDKRAEVVDAMAACYILQGVLEILRN